jgi:5S rRNA maturation endonuclease (ribonuclease M5)
MTVEEMQDVLARLGVEFYSTRNYEIQAECPAHEERTGHKDRNPSFYINADTGLFICFSCGWKGTVNTLIRYVSGSEDTRQWLSSGAGLSTRIKRLTQERPKIEEQTHITESMLGAFTTPPEHALRARGLTVEAAHEYGLLWDERKQNWILQIRDPKTDKLLGWQEKGFATRYFRNYPTGVQKSSTLFGFNRYEGGDLIVVESPLDVVRLASLVIHRGVAVYGAIVSKEQFNIIRGADRVIFAMDNDEAGLKSSSNLLDLCKEYEKEAWFFNYKNTDMKDVGAMSKDEIVYGLEHAKHIVHGKKALHG